jgi:hypothetical protein
MFSVTDDSLQFNNIDADLRQELLRGVPARALAANPDLQPGSKVLKMNDLGLTVTGPLIVDKLWFVGTLKRSYLDQLRVGSYNPDGTQFVDDNKMVTYTGKLSYATSSSSQLHYTYLYSNKQRFHRSGNNLTTSGRAPRRTGSSGT